LSAVSLTISAAKVPVAAGLLGYVLAGRARSWPLSNASHAARARSGEVTATVNGNGVTAPLMTNAAP
ncbi:molecular chaperone, partial [Caballeronia sp. LZ029]|nr:molecular chaperone [Caballeronia sp. LZ029]